MVNEKLLHPKSIVVVGASNNTSKPGGKILKNLLDNHFNGELYAVNPKEELIQNIKSFKSVNELPHVDLAILAIPAQFCVDTVKILAEEKHTNAFIIISAGFSETNEKGKQYENEIVKIWPNPVSKELSVKSNKNIQQITVYDIAGSKMKLHTKQNNGIYQIDFTSVNSGIFLLECSFEDGSKLIRKIVRN